MHEVCESGWLDAPISRSPFPRSSNWISLLVLAVILATLWPARAEDADYQYVRIFDLLQQPQTPEKEHPCVPALANYRQAVPQNLSSDYPAWERTLVACRANLPAAKIDALSEKLALGSVRGGTPQTERQPAAESIAPAVSSGEQVKLLNPGIRPRQTLRFHPKVGDKQTLEMTLNIASGAKTDQMQMPPSKMPPIKITAKTKVQDVSPEGDITYRFVIADAAVGAERESSPRTATIMKETLDTLKGLSETLKISSRGIKDGNQFRAPPSASPQVSQLAQQLGQSLSDLCLPLPEEAVGAGARWRAKSQIKSQGWTVDRASEYRLVSFQRDHLIIQSTTTENASNQTTQSQAIPGMTIHMTRMAGKATGNTTLDLARLLPEEGSLNMHTEVSMSMASSGQRQSLTTTAHMKMTMQSR
jgi:Family of unknown function (DUF6263)